MSFSLAIAIAIPFRNSSLRFASGYACSFFTDCAKSALFAAGDFIDFFLSKAECTHGFYFIGPCAIRFKINITQRIDDVLCVSRLAFIGNVAQGGQLLGMRLAIDTVLHIEEVHHSLNMQLFSLPHRLPGDGLFNGGNRFLRRIQHAGNEPLGARNPLGTALGAIRCNQQAPALFCPSGVRRHGAQFIGVLGNARIFERRQAGAR